MIAGSIGLHVALGCVAGVQELETVRLRWVGHRVRAEAAVVVGAELSLV